MKARKSWGMAYCGMAGALSVALVLLGALVSAGVTRMRNNGSTERTES